MMKKKSIAIDMDNVIGDIEAHMINWYESKHGFRIERESMRGIPEIEAFPDSKAARDFFYTPGFFRTLPVMPGAVEALKRLMQNFNVYIVSAAMEFPQSLTEKYQWLEEHFPFITWHNIVFCGDKSLIFTDYLIDDHTWNLDSFRGKPILFTSGHNVNYSGYERVNNWQEAVQLLESELEQE